MTIQRITVRKDSFRNLSDLKRDLKCIRLARKTFELKIDPALLDRLENEWDRTAFVLGSRDLPGPNDSWWSVLHKRSTGVSSSAEYAALYRSFGYPAVAELFERHDAWLDTAIITKLDGKVEEDHWNLPGFCRDDDGNCYDFENKEAWEADWRKLQMEAAEVFRAAGLPAPDFDAAMEAALPVNGVDTEAFDAYWAGQIMASDRFQSFRMRWKEEEWFAPACGFFGWLGKPHREALRKRGYDYLFPFWGRQDGFSLGELWVQTDRGPLRLYNASEEGLLCHFPIPVRSLDGAPLFELTIDDVPAPLRADKRMVHLREGEGIPKRNPGPFGRVLDILDHFD